MTATQPPPGWAEKVRWLRSVIEQAEAEIQAAILHGGRGTLVAEQKRHVAYRQLDQLMAARPR
jgi:hypothetical protein